MRYKLSDKTINNLLNKLVVTIDTREKANKHIIDFFETMKIAYKVEKLPFGDYSCKLPKGSLEGQLRDIYFFDDIVIERKANIDEIAGNLKDDAARLKKELAHLNKYNTRFYIFIEDSLYHKHIRNGKYRSQYEPKTLYNRIKKGIEAEYNTIFVPIEAKYMGSEIYNTLASYVYYKFKHEGWIEEVDF